MRKRIFKAIFNTTKWIFKILNCINKIGVRNRRSLWKLLYCLKTSSSSGRLIFSSVKSNEEDSSSIDKRSIDIVSNNERE